jgi:dihydrodipicolinate synthase/N-acetylneuraminate lyase
MNHRNPMFRGIFVPIITPLNTDKQIHKKGIINILNYLYNNGISGIWLLGSYGGFPLLTEEERIQVAEIALKRAKELGMTVIVNVGSLYTDMAIRLAKHAQENGAHAVASVVPFYYASSHYRDSNFLAYFKDLSRSVNIPVFFYNNEKATGYKPTMPFFAKLLELGVQGFKSKGDYLAMNREIKTVKTDGIKATYLTGSTSLHLQGYLLGADGVTSGVALAVPRLVVGLQNALDSNNIDEAIRLQNLVLQARTVMGKYVGRAVACYDILHDKGVDAGTCRSPWLRMKADQVRDVLHGVKAIEEMI